VASLQWPLATLAKFWPLAQTSSYATASWQDRKRCPKNKKNRTRLWTCSCQRDLL